MELTCSCWWCSGSVVATKAILVTVRGREQAMHAGCYLVWQRMGKPDSPEAMLEEADQEC